MIIHFWNWIKETFRPKRQNPPIVLQEEETAKQKKIRLKHQGDNK